MRKLLLIAALIMITMSCAGKTIRTEYSARYFFSFSKVERPEKAIQRYGPKKIGKDEWGGFTFEDKLVEIRWVVTARGIHLSLKNKTNHSIKIPWDQAVYVGKNGVSYRVLHDTDEAGPQPPSVVVRKSSLNHTIGGWILFPDYESILSGKRHDDWNRMYKSFSEFERAVHTNVGKSVQVLLPLQVEEAVYDYIFTFHVDSASAKEEVDPDF